MPRPRTLAELANVATTDSYDPSRSLKDQLRAADQLRRDAKGYAKQGQLEPAFVNAARAATMILEKMPSHPQYAGLKREQKDALKGVSQTLGGYALSFPLGRWEQPQHSTWLLICPLSFPTSERARPPQFTGGSEAQNSQCL